jgi:hypothetical protein
VSDVSVEDCSLLLSDASSPRIGAAKSILSDSGPGRNPFPNTRTFEAKPTPSSPVSPASTFTTLSSSSLSLG